MLWPTYGTGPAPQNTISYTGAGQPAQPISDPWKAFQRIFMGLDTSNPDNAAVLRLKRTQLVLDAAAAEYKAMMPSLGAEDKIRLQEHLGRFEEIKPG